MDSKRILVIGSLNMDLTAEMDKMPVLGETVIGTTVHSAPGGKGANQACAAGRLGGRTAMLGCVGTDAFGEGLLKSLEDAGVDAERIARRKEPSGTATIWVQKGGGNSIVVIPGANGSCDSGYLKKHSDFIGESDLVVLQLEIPLEGLYYAIDTAHQLGKTIILNPAPMTKALSAEYLKKTDYLTPNETELSQLFGIVFPSLPLPAWPELTAEALATELNVTFVVTLGEKGALLADGTRIRRFPSISCKAVDTTAAGDCFNGALAVKLAEGASLEEAIQFAILAAGISVTRQGAQSALPSREEVEGLLRVIRE